MNFSQHDHALIRGLLIGAVVLASATACSRSDRADTGSNSTGTMTADTSSLEGQGNAVTPPAGDTTTGLSADTSSTATAAPAPRSESAPPRAETGSNRDTATAGYSGMERDTTGAEAAAPRDSARVITDTAAANTAAADTAAVPGEQSSVTPSDSAPSDSAPMEVATPTTGDTLLSTADTSVEMAGAARDTSNMPEQADTAMAAGQVDVAVEANADTAGTITVAPSSSDSTVQVGDSANIGRTGERLDPVVASAEVNDTLPETAGEPVRPPEDSTEVYGNVTENAPADEQDINREERETVAVSETETGANTDTDATTDEVGAAAIGGNVTGAAAVALMTRQGVQCVVVDVESAQGVALDMSETPATLNPCGLGSMVPTRIWTEKE